jgi:hypothetical protein
MAGEMKSRVGHKNIKNLPALVAAGEITQEQADKILKAHKKRKASKDSKSKKSTLFGM